MQQLIAGLNPFGADRPADPPEKHEDSKRGGGTGGEAQKDANSKEDANSKDQRKKTRFSCKGVKKSLHHAVSESVMDEDKDVCKKFSVFFAVFVRLVLLTFIFVEVYVVVDTLGDPMYWLMVLLGILLLIESGFTIWKRRGQERAWVCVCFAAFLLAAVPPIWIIELHKAEEVAEEADFQAPGISSVAIAGKPDKVTAIIEQMLLFLLIVMRWILPRGDISRDQLSSLLFVYIGMASDIMDFFSIFNIPEVRNDLALTYVILYVWTVALMQFCLVLTMSGSPKTRAGAKGESRRTTLIFFGVKASSKQSVDEDEKNRGFKKGFMRCFRTIIQTELWSLLVSIFMQDMPFLIVRVYALAYHDLVNYSIIFFICKNSLVVALLLYRLVVLILKEKFEAEHRTAKQSESIKDLQEVQEEEKPVVKADKKTNGTVKGKKDAKTAEEKPVEKADKKTNGTVKKDAKTAEEKPVEKVDKKTNGTVKGKKDAKTPKSKTPETKKGWFF